MTIIKQDMELYERKIIQKGEFPVQIVENHILKKGLFCKAHWHEHIEMHYILNGVGKFCCNHVPLTVEKGDLIIFNSNELHELSSQSSPFDAFVLIFEIGEFSKEVANCNILFEPIIHQDCTIQKYLTDILKELKEKRNGYKLAMKGSIYQLITYLMREYVKESITNKEQIIRNKNLTRLNTVFQYIQEHYSEPLTNQQLAKIIHLSEYRFCHLFKESIGQSPLSYINEVRLKKAYHLLESTQLTIAEICLQVGFQDYNNFGRLFRRYFGFPPSGVWKQSSEYHNT